MRLVHYLLKNRYIRNDTNFRIPHKLKNIRQFKNILNFKIIKNKILIYLLILILKS
jgi:hypothetical protein